MPNTTPDVKAVSAAPFDTDHLDALMEEAGLNALIVSSAYNLRYLLGGYRFFLYDKLDGVGISRYLPLIGYVRGRPDLTFYVAWGDEGWGLDTSSIWVPHVEASAWTAIESARRAAALLEEREVAGGRIGLEMPFMAADAYTEIQRELNAELVDAVLVLDELRAVKTETELEIMRTGADLVVDSMLAVFGDLRGGQSTSHIAEQLRQEETRRGLVFDYCLIAAAPDLNRAPSARQLQPGAALSLDSGASYQGYVADLARMGVIGAPSTLQEELLEMVAAVQAAARAEVREGAPGAQIYAAASEAIAELSEPSERFSFVAHGMGLRSHEAPRLNVGKPPYPATHRDRPLVPGMVLSIETHIAHPEAGFVKLEDAVFVTETGCQPIGDHGRSWNRAEA